MTVAGRTISVRVETLTARVEPESDYVRGTAPAGRSIWVSVSSNPGCDQKQFDQWTSSNGAGNFAANLASNGNILRGDYVRIFLVDANNNGTVIVRYAPIASVYNLYSEVDGYTTPHTSVTAVLKNASGSIKDTRTTEATYYGYYYVLFSSVAAVGDKVEITADGEVMPVSVVALTAKVDASTNAVSGIGPGPGTQLRVQGCHASLPYG